MLDIQAAKEVLCSHKAARHIALHLLAPGSKRYLPAHAAAMLRPASLAVEAPDPAAQAPRSLPASDKGKSKEGTAAESLGTQPVGRAEDGEEEELGGDGGPRAGASKKDPMVRRKEILGQGLESLGHALAEAAAAGAASLLQSPLGSEMLVEIACGGEAGGAPCSDAPPWRSSVPCEPVLQPSCLHQACWTAGLVACVIVAPLAGLSPRLALCLECLA